MKKGFTLVEMLAVILILGVILLIGVPIYQGVQKSTNESIYESKIANVKSKAEKYSAESGEFIYDINYMIREGLLTPDNESGEYIDPRNGRDMRCDLVRIELVDESYYANIEETESCYSIEELQSMNSVVKIVFYKESTGTETFPNGWIRAKNVYAGYTVPSGVTVKSATWSGGWNVVNDRLEITASEILNVPITLNIAFEYNGQPYKQTVSRNVMIDLQSPTSSVKKGPGTEPISTLEYVEWRLSDGDGSGVAGHLLLNESQYATKKCYEYTADEIPGDDKTNVGEYLDNGTYYMCVKDNVGNVTNDEKENALKVIVSNVDYDSGAIKNLKVESRTAPYQLMDVKIITELKDTNTSKHEMCISHTGYLQNCTWEKYDANKDYTISGYNYGDNVLFFISVKDEAGNISNKEGTYTIDNLQYLDLNGKLNGTNQSNITNLGTCDVYINGTKVKASVSDYYEQHAPGTQYTIKNCTSKSGYRYKGSAEVSGTIGRGSASSVYLPYVSLYTISYNMNGGTGSISNQTKEHDSAITLSSTKPSRDNYTFTGWNTKSDGKGTAYASGASYTTNSGVTLYAQWQSNPYLDLNGSLDGTNQSNISPMGKADVWINGKKVETQVTDYYKQLPPGTKYEIKNITSSSGYKYDSTETSFSGTMGNSNIDVRLKYKTDKYTITYNANGGSGTMASQTATNGSTITLTNNAFTHSTKVFAGWATSAGGSKTYNNKETITLTSNLTLYAVWKEYDMHEEGQNLIIEAKFVVNNARYTTFYGGGCGDHHSFYLARIGIIYGGYTAGWHSRNSDDRHYVVAGDKYLWTDDGHSSKWLDGTYYMAGPNIRPDSTNISFKTEGSGFMEGYSNNTEVKYCEGRYSSTCHKVADKFSYSYNLTQTSCNHYDTRSSTPMYCNLLITFRGEFENYDATQGYPTGIGLHVDEWAEEGGGPGSDESNNGCCVTQVHRNLNLS